MTQQEYIAAVHAAKAGECPAGMTEEQWEWAELADILEGIAEERKSGMLAELMEAKGRGVVQVWYGHVEQAEPIRIDEAIHDITAMDPDAIGEGSWGEWPDSGRN